MKIFKIMQKNLRMLFRSRFTSLVILFGPLLVILLIGYAFNNFSNYKIQVGTFSEEYSELSNKYLVEMSGSNFKVTKYGSKDECIQEIKYGGIHTCLVFPKNFEILSESNTLEFYVDPSNVNLVWMVIDEVSKKIELSSSKVSLNITQDIMSRLEKSSENTKLAMISLDTSTISVNKLNIDFDEMIAKLTSQDIPLSLDSSNYLDTTQLSSAISSLYTNSKTVAGKVAELTSSIKSSSTWSQLNSTQQSALNSLMNSVESSATSLRTTIDTKYNDSENRLSILVENIYELNNNIADLETTLGEIVDTNSEISSKLLSLKTDVSGILTNLDLVKSYLIENNELLSGISVKNAKSIVSPVSTLIIPVTDEKDTQVNYLFPALIVLIIMFICLLLSSLNIVLEKNSRAYFRNFVTPTSDVTFLFSSFFTNMFVMLTQLAIIFLMTFFLFDKSVLHNVYTTSLILFITSAFFVVVGMIVGYMFSSEEGAILGTISISSILFFISNLIMPLDALPETIKFFVDLNPFVIASNLLKRAFLFNVSFDILSSEILFFSFYLMGAIVLLFIVQKINKLKFFYHNNLKNKKVEIIDDKKIQIPPDMK